MRIHFLLIVASAVMLGGCSTMHSVSDQEVDEFFSNYEASFNPSKFNKEKFKLWIQPDNKNEPCNILVWSETNSIDPNIDKLYWDGDCKDGYAHGLGREFVETKDSKLYSELNEYTGGISLPKRYASSNFDAHVYMFGDPLVGNGLEILAPEEDGAFDLITRNRYVDDSGTLYLKETYLSNNIQWLQMTSGELEDGYVLLSEKRPDGKYIQKFFTLKDGNPVGYMHIREPERQYNTALVDGEWIEAKLPGSYFSRMQDIRYDIILTTAKAEKYIAESDIALDRYRLRVCYDEINQNFIDPEIYGQICNDNGDLSILDDKAEALVERKRVYEQGQREQLSNAKQQAALNAERQSRLMNQVLDTLNTVGNSMQRASQNALYQSQSYQLRQPSIPSVYSNQNNSYGTTMHPESACTGAVVMGRCNGTIIPSGSSHEKCYGTVLNGSCVGPQY